MCERAGLARVSGISALACETQSVYLSVCLSLPSSSTHTLIWSASCATHMRTFSPSVMV
eukprot:COSAG05_NODE_1699_length_4254_cov_3.541276_6_plen_58_part_01